MKGKLSNSALLKRINKLKTTEDLDTTRTTIPDELMNNLNLIELLYRFDFALIVAVSPIFIIYSGGLRPRICLSQLFFLNNLNNFLDHCINQRMFIVYRRVLCLNLKIWNYVSVQRILNRSAQNDIKLRDRIVKCSSVLNNYMHWSADCKNYHHKFSQRVI